MFKKSLLILILFFSFNLSVNAACDGIWNTYVPGTESPQECRANDDNNYDYNSLNDNWNEESKLLQGDYSDIKVKGTASDIILNPSNYDEDGYKISPSSEEIKSIVDKRLSEIKVENTILNENIKSREIDYNSNETVINENEQNLEIFTNNDENWDALNKEVEVNSSIEKIVDLQDNIDALKKQDEELGISHNADKIKELEEQRDAIIVPTYTEEEQKVIDEKNRLEEKQKADLEAIENGEVLMTEAQKEAARAKVSEADKKAADKRVDDEKKANPGLERLGKSTDAGAIRNALLDQVNDGVVNINKDSEGGLTTLGGILIWIKDALMGLLMLIAIGAFLYIGIKLSFARGNPEEFKKAMMHLVYAVVGIFIVSIAWATVTLIAGLTI